MGILRDLFGAGTWGVGGNLLATVITGVLTGGVALLARNRIGRHLAAWWDAHHGPRAVERHKQALREHAAETGDAGD